VIRVSDNFRRALGIRNPRPTGTTSYTKPSAPPKVRPAVTKAARQTNAVIEAAERQRRLYERYVQNRAYRFGKVKGSSLPVRKFLATLHRIEPETEYIPDLDCDVDLSDIARQCKLGPDCGLTPYELFLVYEEARDFVGRLAKRAKVKLPFSGDDWFEITPPTALDDLKKVLGLH